MGRKMTKQQEKVVIQC